MNKPRPVTGWLVTFPRGAGSVQCPDNGDAAALLRLLMSRRANGLPIFGGKGHVSIKPLGLSR